MQSTHVATTFEVNGNFDKLHFETFYTPKIQDDYRKCIQIARSVFATEGDYMRLSEKEMSLNFPLKNHISWSFDSPCNFLGTKHLSWQKQQHFISAESSSLGLFPSKIWERQWRITASLNCIVTDYVDIKYLVWGEKYVEKN